MTFKTLLLAGASVALLGACSAPNEYSTYEPDHSVSSYNPKSWSMWKKNDAAEVEITEMSAADDTTPMDITPNSGRVE